MDGEQPHTPALGDELVATVTAGGSSGRGGGYPILAGGSRLGRYTILDTLGEGGMGVVYGAYDPDLDRRVALKLLRVGDGGSASGAARSRLLGEARAMAKLTHANVITVYEVGTVGDRDFVAMEFVEGESLAAWLDTDHDWREVVRVFRQAGQGLAAAHRGGLVHRDFKPANVLLDQDGRVLVTDFGLAQERGVVAEDDGSDPPASTVTDAVDSLTRSEGLVGTPAYMAPEQHRGEPACERSDQFSFCVALHEALYGARPFSGDTLDELRESVLAGRLGEEPKGSSVPSRVRRVVVRGLSPDPDDRFASMAALLSELRYDPAQLRRRLAALGVVIITVVVIAWALFAGGSDEEPCADGDRNFVGVWDDTTRAELVAAFEDTGFVGAAASLQGFVRAVDDYKATWTEIYATTCAATRVRHEISEEDFHLHMGCLLDRRNQVESLTEIFKHPDPEIVEHAVQAAQSLPSLDTCADIDALRSGLSPPRDPATAAAVAEVRAELARVKALQETIRYQRAVEGTRRAVRRAEEIGYKPLEAEARYRLGRLYYLTGQPKLARATLDEAILAAEESSHDEIRARALVALVELGASFSSDYEATRKLARHAQAAVSRHGGDESLTARAVTALARILVEEGHYDEAIAGFNKAAAIYKRVGGGDSLLAAKVEHRVALIHRLRGDSSRALALHEKALAAQERQLGSDHPSVARSHELVGEELRRLGRYDAARGQFAIAARYWRSERGREVLAVAAPATAGHRRVRGRVVSHAGNPVVGAEVVVGEVLFGDGKYLYGGLGAHRERELGIARTKTDGNGAFSFPEVGGNKMYIAAEQSDVGRTLPVEIPVGRANVDEVSLRLRPFGRVVGKVSTEGERPVEVEVSAVPELLHIAGRAGVAVSVDDSGEFEFERLPAGDYYLLLSIGGHLRAASVQTLSISVAPGQTTEVEFSFSAVDVVVDLVVRGEGGAILDEAQLFVFPGKVAVADARSLEAALLSLTQRGQFRMGFANPYDVASGDDAAEVDGDKHLEFGDLAPGNYSVCVLPIGGELKDPSVRRRINDHVEELAVYCDPVAVSAQRRQRIVVEVPPMKPLPRSILPP